MSRPYPNRPRKHKGRPPPHRYRGSSRKPQPGGFRDFGFGRIYDTLPPEALGPDRRRAYNRIADWTALTAAALGLQAAGIVGAVIGFRAGHYISNGGLARYRLIRR